MCHTNLVLQLEFSNDILGECLFFHALSNEMSPCPRLIRIWPILTAFRLYRQSKHNKTLACHSSSTTSSSMCSTAAIMSRGRCFHICLSYGILWQMVLFKFISPPSCRSSSTSFPFVGFQVVIRCVHRLTCILLACPAQVHVSLLTCSITSDTFVFSLT